MQSRSWGVIDPFGFAVCNGLHFHTEVLLPELSRSPYCRKIWLQPTSWDGSGALLNVIQCA